MTTKPFFVSLFLLGLLTQAHTQESSVRWFGDVRVRSEADMRDFNQRTPANTYTLLRTRFGLEAKPLEDVRIFIQARDSRVFGQETNTLSDSRNLDLHQGYIEISKLFVEPLMLRLGRQELSYGNERIVGTVGWHNVGRVFDGGFLRIDVEALTLDLFAMNIREVQPYVPIATPLTVAPVNDEGADFFGSHVMLKQLSGHTLNGYVFYEWYREISTATPSSPRVSRFTLGTYAKGLLDVLDYEAEVAYQGGKLGAVDISAYMLTASLGYNIASSVLSRVAAGYEVLSGTSDGVKYRTFDPMFHTGHKFYGFMDYFINIPANTTGRGLQDLFLRATVRISEKANLHCWVHHFAYHRPMNGRRVLGREIDLVFNLRYNKNVTFEVGASVFEPDVPMRQKFGAADAALWGYVQTSVTF